MKNTTDEELKSELEKIYQKYEEILFKASNNAESSVKAYKARFYKMIDSAERVFQQDAKKFVQNNIPNADISKKAFSTLRKAGANFDNESIKATTYISIVSSLTEAVKGFKKGINDYIRQGEREGQIRTVVDLREHIKATLESGGATTVQYANGRSVKAQDYANMLARTTRIETNNIAMLGIALDSNIDLVEIPRIQSTCPLCAVMQGRVYSISGKSKEYPALYKTAFKSGYSCIHPNCRHPLFPYEERHHTKEENDRMIKESNRSWEEDSKDKHYQQTKDAAEAYNRSQSFMRQLNAERNTYEAMKLAYAEQGKEPPYKSLGAFRRSYRKEKGTEGYEKTHKWRNEI